MWPALGLTTLGITAGGMTTWKCGRYLQRWQKLQNLPHREKLERWGSPTLLLSWLPLVSDALCLAAGWLRIHWKSELHVDVRPANSCVTGWSDRRCCPSERLGILSRSTSTPRVALQYGKIHLLTD
jgi:hypothetical protein